MPRLTSFFDSDPSAAPIGREWQIRAKYALGLGPFSDYWAYRDDQKIQISRSPKDKSFNLMLAGGFASDLCFDIEFPINGDVFHGRITPLATNTFTCNPETLKIRLVAARIEVSIAGTGRAIFRNSWRDSDLKKKILGFVDTDCQTTENERSLVWLAGTLGLIGLPYPAVD